jgi:fructose-bisphosphate aldolase class II
MIGVSEGERDFVGVGIVSALVKEIRRATGMSVFLNADHTHSLDRALTAAHAGYDEIIFDASKLPLSENIAQTKQAVIEIKSINPDILVEGEIGYIGSSSEILTETPVGAAIDPASFSTVEEARQFVHETRVDILAPAVGTMHGLLASMVSGAVFKHIDSNRVREIAEATGSFLTLHGGSGTADADFTAAISSGITIVHVNTELRLAWRSGVADGLSGSEREVAPYKLLTPALIAVSEIVERRLRLFNQL